MRRKPKSEVAWQQWIDHCAGCRQCYRVQYGGLKTPCPDGEEMLTVWRMWQRVELEQAGGA